MTFVSFHVSFRAVDGVEATGCKRILRLHDAEQLLVYLLTGTHGAHLLGGIVALFIAGVASLLHRSLKARSIVVDVTAWYWHFMALLWVYVFCLMKFAG